MVGCLHSLLAAFRTARSACQNGCPRGAPGGEPLVQYVLYVSRVRWSQPRSLRLKDIR
jgi:hypothetical protein